MNAAKPIGAYIKAACACAVLIAFGLGFSWAAPFVSVTCARNGERVECQLRRQMLGLITFETTKIRDVVEARFHFEDGSTGSSRTKASETGYLMLVDADRVEKKILLESGRAMDMSRSKSFVKGIESFLRGDEPTFSAWTVPLIGYAAFFPFAIGALLLGLITWDFGGNCWKTLRPTNSNPDSTDGQ